MKKSRKGGLNIETAMMMILLILFGSAIFTLIYAGQEAQKRVVEEKEIKINARVASSYIDVKIKKYDAEGAISIEVNPITNENAIVFKDEPNLLYSDEELYTWIFFEDGILYTQTITKGEELVSGLGIEIAKIDGFDISIDDNKITSIIEYTTQDTVETMENVTIVRSLD